MFRILFRLILLLVVVGFAATFVLGARMNDKPDGKTFGSITDGSLEERTERAREAGARLGEKVARGAERATDALEESTLTAKIKSKIALDDTLDGATVTVSTDGDVVSLTGRVSTAAQHKRVLQLASETRGVARVVDHITVR